jgi:hypothetical protein
MAITIKNLHSQLPEDQLHEAKGFTTASNNSYLKKNNDGESEWSQSIHLSKSALSADPTPLEMLRLEVTDDGVDMAAGHGPAITFFVGETGGSDWGGTIGVVREIESDADSASAMVFHTAIDDTYPAERMRIGSTGDVTITGGLTLGTDLSVANGGTGASTFTDGGVLLGSGTGAVTAMAVLADGEMIVGDGSTDPVAESGSTLRTSIGVSRAESFVLSASDETTALTTGTAKMTFRMPYAFTITDARASVTTAPVGSVLTVDINDGGTTILSTKITIDAGEKTSTTAATAKVISDTALADDAEVTVDIDAVGSGTAGAGLKVTLIGYQTTPA